MRKNIGIPALVALTLTLAVPAFAQSPHAHGAAADAAKAAAAVDPDKAYLLHQEYVAKTGELRGKIAARQAELETLLAAKPGDEAAVRKLAGEISALRGQLFEQTTLFRIRVAKETGMPIRMTRGLEHMGGKAGMMGMMGMMDGKDKDMECMAGKDMGMMMGKGMMMDKGMGKGMDMQMPANAADAPKAQ